MTAAHVLQNTSMTHLALDMAHAAASGIALAHLAACRSFVVGRFARGFLAMSREFKTGALKSLTWRIEDLEEYGISFHHQRKCGNRFRNQRKDRESRSSISIHHQRANKQARLRWQTFAIALQHVYYHSL